MKNLDQSGSLLSGRLLVAHPALLDPNFRRSVILISAHSEEEGALGVVLNRPLGQTLKDFGQQFDFPLLQEVPLFYGGPVDSEKMILTAWSWSEADRVFTLMFGLSPEKAEELLLQNPLTEIKGFLGYSGWSKGQLEDELSQDAWIVGKIDSPVIHQKSKTGLWRTLVGILKPELRFLANAPDDPSLN